MSRLIGTMSCMWLVVLVISTVAQPSPVLDTTGQPLKRGVEYYIVPETNQTGGGGITLVDRNGSCPLYVGQDDNPASNGISVTFTPFLADDTIIGEARSFRVAFSAATTCIQSTAWSVGETDPKTQRRLIATGGDSQFGVYFNIVKNGDSYNLDWCPADVCPVYRFICGSAGPLIENGKRLLALDGPLLPVVFNRA